jgi:hypothetical protein
MLSIVKEVTNEFRTLKFGLRYGVIVATVKGNVIVHYDVLDKKTLLPFKDDYHRSIVVRGIARVFKAMGLN